MELKPELVKTIRRLSTQKNFDVLKNKLRSWLVTREISVADLIRHCREKTINVPAVVLNKLGILYGSGKEGVLEDSDTAFWFYLAAADFGYGPSNGNVAQYYYDGRAPGGRNMELAFQYCRKALELGTDKFMLMSEILHKREDFPETVCYLRKIIENRHYDNRRRVEARKLEMECMQKQLLKLFVKLAAYENAGEMAAVHAVSSASKPLRPYKLALQITTRLPVFTTPQQQKSPLSLSLEASMHKLANVPYLPSPIPMRPMTPLNSHLLNSNSNTPGTNINNISPNKNHAHDKVHVQHYNPHRRGFQSNTNHFTSPQQQQHRAYQSTYQHRLPGWFYLSDDLEGFDYNACAALTARFEVIELEAQAIKSAYEAAEAHVANARQHKFSEEIIQMLVKHKLHEFQDIYRALEENKNLLLTTWNAYIDTAEHTLRRQVLTEKKFFQPGRMTNPLCLHLAQELFKRRLYSYPDYIDADWHIFFKPSESLNEPLLLLEHSPFPYRIASSRTLITAERALLETAVSIYGCSNSYQFTQQTGWTGKLNLHVFDPTYREAPVAATATANGAEGQQQGGEMGEAKAPEHAATNKKSVTNKAPSKLDDDANVQQHPHHPHHHHHTHAKPHSMSHLRAQIREQLLSEHTFTETIFIGSTRIRLAHKTHPLLTTHHLQAALDSNRRQQASLLQTAQQHPHPQPSQGSVSPPPPPAAHLPQSLKKTVPLGSSHNLHSHSSNQASKGTHPNGSPNQVLQALQQQEQMLMQAVQHVRGDDYYWMEELGHSDEILAFLQHVTLTDVDSQYAVNERKLAEMMLRFTHDGTPLDVKELQLINEDCLERDVHMLTKICYHYFIKRLVPWVLSFPTDRDGSSLSPSEGANITGNEPAVSADASGSRMSSHSGGYRSIYELPLASGQARALQLVRHGLLSFRELFTWDGEYGIFHCGMHREVVSTAIGTASSSATSAGTTTSDTTTNDPAISGSSRPTLATNPPRSSSPLRTTTTAPATSAATSTSSTSAAAAAAKQELVAAAAASEALLPEHPHAMVQLTFHDYAQLRRQLININALYQRAILDVSAANFLSTMQFWKAHKKGVTIPTYQRLRQELQECYGGEIDSDEEDDDEEDGEDHADGGSLRVHRHHHLHHHHHHHHHHHQLSGEDWEATQYGAEDRELDFLWSKLRI